MKKNAVFILCFLMAVISPSIAQDKIFAIHIQFDANIPLDLEVVPAILKYNKEFAFSFTFDDGLDDAYSLGFKLLSGGYSSVDGITYPGLFSTDGCGNRFPFRAGIAWYTVNQYNVDLHNGSPGYIAYAEAIELYHSGWDFFNHSYNHEANSGSVDYRWQLASNSRSFKSNTGIDLRHCVPPSGDTSYIAPAFSIGSIACFTSSYGYNGCSEVSDVTVPVSLPNPVYWRHLINSDDDTPASLKQAIESWVATTGPGKQKWWNEFTHRVDYKHTGSSLEFPDFREYFNYLEKNFGSSGKDNGWFASAAEVFEYLIVRDKVVIQLQKIGSVLVVLIDYSQVPTNFRYYDLSLLIKTTDRVQSVSYESPGKATHSETSNGYLINIDVPDSHFAGVEPIMPETRTLLKGFPIPVRGRFFLPLPDNVDEIDVSISNILSEIMPRPHIFLSNGLIVMDFASGNYPPGLYFIQVSSKGRFIGFSKIIVDL